MKTAKRPPFAMQAGLALALGVSASFMHVAASPMPALSIVEARSKTDLQDMKPADKAKLRDNVKRAMAELRDMNQFLARCCEFIMSGEHIPPQGIEEEPFTSIAASFRELESAMSGKWSAFSGMPIIAQELGSLRKALATARFRAAQNALLLKQRSMVPEVAPSDLNMQGLQELTAYSTKRLLKLVS